MSQPSIPPLEATLPEPERIVTDYWPKPIPPRNFDWMAWRDGREEDGEYGFGRTEQDAIDDLLANEESFG